MLLNCGVGEDSWESLGLQGGPASPSYRRSVLGVHWKDWCWRWNSNTLATSCEELTHLKRPWCWERLNAGEEGMTEDEMVGWHHQPDGHESDRAPGVGDGQGSLACCNTWGRKELDMTERLNWTLHVSWISRGTISSFVVLPSWFWTSLLFCVRVNQWEITILLRQKMLAGIWWKPTRREPVFSYPWLTWLPGGFRHLEKGASLT